MKILIVEDNLVNRKILEMSLREYPTVPARTGKEALECLKSYPDIQLIITDIMMPEMDGLEFINLVKQHIMWKEIPVIMCTTLSDGESVKKSIEMGCRDYLVKPIEPSILLQKVRKALNHKKQIPFQKNQTLSGSGIDPEFYKKIIQIFSSQLNEKIAQLEKHLQEDTPVKLLEDLFELTEGATFIKATKVIDILNRLAAKEEELDAETIRSEYDSLLKHLKKLQSIYG
jgi:CheY-like chemotaxis protein